MNKENQALQRGENFCIQHEAAEHRHGDCAAADGRIQRESARGYHVCSRELAGSIGTENASLGKE